MDSGYINQLKMCMKVAVGAKCKRDGRADVTKAEILAELFNELVMSGEVNGMDVVALIDRSHICEK